MTIIGGTVKWYVNQRLYPISCELRHFARIWTSNPFGGILLGWGWCRVHSEGTRQRFWRDFAKGEKGDHEAYLHDFLQTCMQINMCCE